MELEKTVKDALSAFDTFKKELSPKIDKIDAFDAEKLNRVEKAIGDAIELSQKESGKVAALEAQVKSFETMLARPAAPETKEDSKERIAACFKEWAKDTSEERSDFHTWLKRNGKQMELKDLTVNVDSQGGFLVMPTFGGIVQTLTFETSPIRQLATVQNISTDAYEVVADYDETGASWVAETQARTTTTTPALAKINIPTQEMLIQVQATQKILDDSAINMEEWLARKIGDKAARLEATAFVTGDGVARPRGITTYAAGTSVASGQIQQVNMGSTSAFVYDGIVDVQNSLKEVYQANATWLMKRATFGTLMKLKTGIASDNTPVFNMNYGQNNGLPNFTLLGRPVMFADDLATIASASLSVIYGDIRAAYTIVDRIGLRTLRDPYTNKPYVIFSVTKRVGGGVVNFEAVKISKFS